MRATEHADFFVTAISWLEGLDPLEALGVLGVAIAYEAIEPGFTPLRFMNSRSLGLVSDLMRLCYC